MGATSREAIAPVVARLDEYVDASSAADLATVNDELFAVVGLLDREPTLRRSLSDPSAPEDGRVGILDALLAGRLSDPTMTLLRDVARARWSRPDEMVDGIENLGRQAGFAVAEKSGRIDAVEEELFRFGRILDREPELASILSEATMPADGRRRLLDSLIGDRVEQTTRRLLEEAITTPRERSVETSVEELSDLAARRRDRYIAHVRTAVALTDDQERRLADTLGRIYRRAMVLQIDFDKAVLGGVVVQVGDEVIDGSIAGRLEHARRTIAG